MSTPARASTTAAAQRPARRLLEFAHALAQGPLAPRLAAQAKRCLLDNLGCGLFGASQPWTRLMRAEIEAEQPLGACSVFGSARTAAAPAAALVNGTAIHGFELDLTYRYVSALPSSDLKIPAYSTGDLRFS